ncbi:lachesin [Eurytemora carolleeae]|uniref:lachesin n=1 Tax=Eurytemora carolleeae TaxID=1294199 RepID=UPI000C764B8F|nr:lachesin [Eurytemora carolleeae]|eukprot:XP_023345178.1 lachesin-like [Eurytemora affinis]
MVQPSDIRALALYENSHQSEDPLLPYFPMIVENVTVSHGRKAVLKCQVENLRNYKVAWVRVDTQTILTIHNNVISRNPRISLSRPGENKWDLHINSVQESDRGWYMCQINTDPMVHRSGYLEVVVPPRITSQGSSSLVVREGENVSLECEANGYPPPHIVWRREDGDDISVAGKKVSIVERAVLRLDRISRLNMGDYLCVASNGIPPSASNRFSVKVQFPPMFWIPSQLEGVYAGQDVTIECHSEAYPKSINYWINNKGAMLVSNDKYEAITVDTGYKIYMKLHIRNITKADFIEYRCVAKNSLGSSDGAISLYEIPATTTTTTTTEALEPEYTTEETTTHNIRKSGRRRRIKARHRDHVEPSNEYERHSYHLETYDRDQEEPGRGEDKVYMERQENMFINDGAMDAKQNSDSGSPFLFRSSSTSLQSINPTGKTAIFIASTIISTFFIC